ncbi:hypothetical protein DRN50_08920 [Thermococci archaeon]|nr:MAG: hypothetical protein DRN50_08920 [Thermococci archaeon]
MEVVEIGDRGTAAVWIADGNESHIGGRPGDDGASAARPVIAVGTVPADIVVAPLPETHVSHGGGIIVGVSRNVNVLSVVVIALDDAGAGGGRDGLVIA